MRCNVCNECDRLIKSQTVTFADGTLTVNIPAGNYGNGCFYCIVVQQNSPGDTVFDAPVVITIGEGTEEYPLTDIFGTQVTASMLKTRRRYKTRVNTTATGGSFRIMDRCFVMPNNNLMALNGTAPTTT